jgi:hypothetical protein
MDNRIAGWTALHRDVRLQLLPWGSSVNAGIGCLMRLPEMQQPEKMVSGSPSGMAARLRRESCGLKVVVSGTPSSADSFPSAFITSRPQRCLGRHPKFWSLMSARDALQCIQVLNRPGSLLNAVVAVALLFIARRCMLVICFTITNALIPTWNPLIVCHSSGTVPFLAKTSAGGTTAAQRLCITYT